MPTNPDEPLLVDARARAAHDWRVSLYARQLEKMSTTAARGPGGPALSLFGDGEAAFNEPGDAHCAFPECGAARRRGNLLCSTHSKQRSRLGYLTPRQPRRKVASSLRPRYFALNVEDLDPGEDRRRDRESAGRRGVLVCNLVAEAIDCYRATLRPREVPLRQTVLREFANAYGQRQCRTIRDADLVEHIDRTRRKCGSSCSSVRRAARVLNDLFEMPFVRRLVGANPCAGLRF